MRGICEDFQQMPERGDCGLLELTQVIAFIWSQFVDQRSPTRNVTAKVYQPLVCITTLSMPRSSSCIIVVRSRTVFEIGFNVNLHFSLRDGNGTVIRGSPL